MNSGPEPRWLDSEEQRAWRSWLYSGFAAIDNIDSDLIKEGMDLLEYHILVSAVEHPKGIRVGDIATKVITSPQRMTQRVKQMERDGLLEVMIDPNDRRCRIITVTPAGEAKLAKAAPSHVESVRHWVVDLLTREEIEVLGRISEKIYRHNAPDSHEYQFPQRPSEELSA